MKFLVDDWKNAPQWLSVRFAALIALYGQLPPESQAAVWKFIGIPQERALTVAGVLFAAVRMWKQRKPMDFQPTQRMERQQ